MTSVTLCIPAYEAEDFVADAIESALAQTHEDVRVLIAVDLSTDDTAGVCLRYADRSGVEVIVHDERQGWAGNVNSLLERVRTDTYAFVFHDDVAEPTFAEVLVGLLERNPDAVLASGAIEIVGDRDNRWGLVELRGDVTTRLATALSQQDTFYSMKSLARSGPVRDGLRLRTDDAGFQADLMFFYANLAHGEAVSVEETLYRKRVWDGSVSGGWRDLPPDELFERRVAVLADGQRLVSQLDVSREERRLLRTLFLLVGTSNGVTGQRDPDVATAGHELAVAAAVLERLQAEGSEPAPVRAAAAPGDLQPVTETVARAIARRRHLLALDAQDRGAGDAVAAALHLLAAAAAGAQVDLRFEQRVRVTRTLLRVGTDEAVAAAFDHGRRLLAERPDDQDALVLTARAGANLGRWTLAAEHLERLVVVAPGRAERESAFRERVAAECRARSDGR